MITILYSCPGCKITDAEVEVVARGSREENITAWVENVVIKSITVHHHLLSPHCRAKKCVNIKIPVNEGDANCWIGKQTDLVPPKQADIISPPQEG